VLNEDYGYVCQKNKIEWKPRIFDFCRAAHQAGYEIIIVTNQSGIARGYFSENQFLNLTRWIHDVFHSQSARLASTWYCPHHPDIPDPEFGSKCPCRKPKPGLILAAASFHDVDIASSVLVGDRLRDLDAGSAAGISRTFLFGRVSFFDISQACGFPMD